MKAFLKRHWFLPLVAVVLAVDLIALILGTRTSLNPMWVGISYLFYAMSGYLIGKDVNRG